MTLVTGVPFAGLLADALLAVTVQNRHPDHFLADQFADLGYVAPRGGDAGVDDVLLERLQRLRVRFRDQQRAAVFLRCTIFSGAGLVKIVHEGHPDQPGFDILCACHVYSFARVSSVK